MNDEIINNDVNNDLDDAEALKTFLNIRAVVDGGFRAPATVEVVAVIFAGPIAAFSGEEVDEVQHHGCDGEPYSRELSSHTGQHLDIHN